MHMIESIESKYIQDFDEIDAWLDKRYNEDFRSYFEDQKNIHKRILNSESKITNDELEKVMIDIPLMLIEVAEAVNRYKLRIESLKLRMKRRQLEYKNDESITKDVVENENIEDKLLISAYQMLIQRVEKEMSYTRELIMGAKKVWDSRKGGDSVVPVIPDTASDPLEGLPDYRLRGKDYIG